MSSLFEAYITNLGKYNEGRLVGETLKFPATTEEVQALLKRIGVDGVRYEEIFITSFDGDVLGLYLFLGVSGFFSVFFYHTANIHLNSLLTDFPKAFVTKS